MATFHISELRGRVLGGRYRLIRPLGAGASAVVYLADDVNLGRRVAVKVLHPALASDQSFLKRFQIEAQVVAALRHPNILRVYDWGDDDDAPYLVTELLAGGSLRAVLDCAELLSASQVVALGLGAASGLDYAHRRGLVHRDIKPGNLLLDEDSHVSIADFGLARAIAEATWTEPVGAVLGTARYAAPEQARGGIPLDGKADVYALALVMVEAACGRIPFGADTVLSTLLARLDRPIPVPGELAVIAEIITAVGQPDPSRRQDAAWMVEALRKAAVTLPPPGPLHLAGPLLTGEPDVDAFPTESAGRRVELFDGDAAPAPAAVDLRSERPGVAEPVDVPSASIAARRAGPVGATAAGPVGSTRPAPRAGRRRWRWAALVAVVLVLAAAATGFALISARQLPLRRVPVVIGQTLTAARGELRARQFRLGAAASVYSETTRAGVIVAQTPSGGLLREHRAVAVTVSLGLPYESVPPLSGLTPSEAQLELEGAKLGLGGQTEMFSTSVKQGQIISWSDSGGRLREHSKVDLVVSQGPPTVAVPAIPAGSGFAQAAAALAPANLAAHESDSYNDTVAKGYVIGTDPAAGVTVGSGTSVTVEISLGPHMVDIPPSVVGQSVDQAVATLQAQGILVNGVLGSPLQAVVSTVPSVGTPVRLGSSIELQT